MSIPDIETNQLIIRFYDIADDNEKDISMKFLDNLSDCQKTEKENTRKGNVFNKETESSDKNGKRLFVILDKKNYKAIGYVQINELDNEYNEVEVASYIIDEYENSFFEIETIKAVIWFSFEKLHKDLVSILVEKKNILKKQVLDDIGFVKVTSIKQDFDIGNSSKSLFHFYRIDSLDGPNWDPIGMYSCQLENMQDFFKKRAETYNEHVASGTRLEQYKRLGMFIPKTDDSIQVLDIGCGTGIELKYIWEKIPNAHITCIDLSKEMLNVLIKNYEEYLDKITIINGSYLDWDYPFEMFDLVVSSQTMHHFEERQKLEVYQNIRYSLKPNGMYIENDFYMDEAGAKQYRHRYEMIISNLPLNTKPGVFHIDIPFTVEKQIEILKNAGFISAEPLEKHIKARGSGGIICAMK